jgi:hypothetical protein
MNLKKIIRQFRYYAQYFPFTINTLLCGIVAFVAYKLLYQPETKEDVSAYRPFIMLMGKMIFWFIIALVALSLISTLATWIYYKWLYKSRNYKLDINFTTETKNGKKNKLYLNALLPGVRRPVLGTIKGRLLYDNYEMTEKFSLLSNKRKENSIWRAAISGKSRMLLPDIKEYQLKGGFVYFEDMLHIFSLAVAQSVSGQFYQPPLLMNEDDKTVYPKKTETLDVRIDQMRRVEGEHLNYKDFEAGDDVRRIVWKVYAKNRDLVVRIPERFEPYASHLYFYASFHASVKGQWLNQAYLKEMLNYYKNNIWTVYDTLSKKEWEMRFMPDQSFTVPEQASSRERAARIISNSVWQQDTPASQYFNARQGAVLCVSSLTDPKELRIILDQCDASTVVYFVKLSRVFRHFVVWGWLKRLIFLPPKDRLNKLRTSWTFSPMRLQIQRREKEIETILESSNVTTGTL